jgi:murein DD-endopeptidase MepM/ murein hydrolase activator NlpD
MIENGTVVENYLTILKNSLTRFNLVGISNNFNGSTYKNRIKMRSNNKTQKYKAIIYMLLIPLVATMIMAFSSSVQINEEDDIPSYTPIKKTDFNRLTVNHNQKIIDPFSSKERIHYGVDIKAKEGTPVYAAGNGSAKIVEEKNGWGNLIVLKHGVQYETWYAHLKAFRIESGQSVKAGEIIGYVGNTGKSSGSHLHFEIRKDGEKEDPNVYIDFK